MAELGLRSGNVATLSTIILAKSIHHQGKYLPGSQDGGWRREGGPGKGDKFCRFRQLLADRHLILRRRGFPRFSFPVNRTRSSPGFCSESVQRPQTWLRAAGPVQVPEGGPEGRPWLPSDPQGQRHSQEQTGSRTRFSRTHCPARAPVSKARLPSREVSARLPQEPDAGGVKSAFLPQGN